MEKLKKATPYLLIALLVGWFCYKFFVERKPPTQPTMALDWDQLDATSGSAPLETPATIKTTTKNVRTHTTLTKEEDEEFRAFDEMEKKWLTAIDALFGPELFTQYMGLRDQNEKEKGLAYQEYHDYLRAKYGDKFSYNISEDQSVREKNINQRYLKELLKIAGEKKFQAYLKERDKINEENRRNNKEFIQIEF